MSTNPIRDEFRDGLSRGDLLVQQCNDCRKLNMYPRHACPHCQSLSLGWRKASGRGVLHSFTVLLAGAPEGFAQDLPYAVGVIKLTEGVQMLARLRPDADGDWKSYRCDEPVEFTAAPPEQATPRACAWFTHAKA
jgi:uncharacterized OB-fold protein